MNIKKMPILLCICLLFVPMFNTEAAKVKEPTKQELFEQQLKIYETNRYIERNQKETKQLKKEIPRLKKEIRIQNKELKNGIEHSKETLIKFYGGEKTMWIDLYMQTNKVEDIMTVQYISEKYTEKELKQLKEVDDNLKKLKKNEQSLEKKKRTLANNLVSLKEKLNDLNQTEELYKTQLGLLKDVEEAKNEVNAFMYKWENEGLPSFKDMFWIMADCIEDLPNSFTRENIKSKGLFTHQVVITDKQLNDFLKKENKLFKRIQFSFDDNQLKFKGTYHRLNFKAKGHYKLKKSGEMKFYIDELQFQNIKLPSVTLEEMEEKYDLGFYPSEFIEGAKVTKINIDNGEFRVDVKL